MSAPPSLWSSAARSSAAAPPVGALIAPAAAAGALPPRPATGLTETARLKSLRASPRGPGEASFFYWDAHFRNEAVKVLPGEYFVHHEDILITTTLGSCIAVCLWDREHRIGGINHFMLPEGPPGDAAGGRYGSYAMEVLINGLLKRGGARLTLEAKVFGGGAVIGGMSSLNVGERNTRFVLDYLKTERIPVLSQDVMDTCARKLCFLPASGKAMVKRLAPTNADALASHERAAAARVAPVASTGGSVDLF